jgi:diphthamide synthase subunit DPH2
MITQQVASYLIKRMKDAATKIDTPAVDATDGSYKEFLRARRDGQDVEPYDVLGCDYDIVKSFQRRASALVCIFLHRSQYRRGTHL